MNSDRVWLVPKVTLNRLYGINLLASLPTSLLVQMKKRREKSSARQHSKTLQVYYSGNILGQNKCTKRCEAVKKRFCAIQIASRKKRRCRLLHLALVCVSALAIRSPKTNQKKNCTNNSSIHSQLITELTQMQLN